MKKRRQQQNLPMTRSLTRTAKRDGFTQNQRNAIRALGTEQGKGGFLYDEAVVSNKTLRMVRVFVANKPPGYEFSQVALDRLLQSKEDYDESGLRPALNKLLNEGAVEKPDSRNINLWRVAGRQDLPVESRLAVTGLLGGQVRPQFGRLAEKFIIPPFSVLNAGSGIWQSRKANWLRLGIQSEVGRGDNLIGGLGKSSVWVLGGTSVFDPVLCEAMYRWFCPPGGMVVDPFAGGSVRGIVAAELERNYWGVDLRPEQVKANIDQLAAIKPPRAPKWVSGDSEEWLSTSPEADMIFTCPPYGDLEKYSDDPRDLSNMSEKEMIKKFGRIIKLAAGRLKENRFFVMVVGDYRDREGYYTNFVSRTIDLCLAAGLKLYNVAILVQANGSLSLRVAKQFVPTRKLGKGHQDIIICVKGDARRAAEVCRANDPPAAPSKSKRVQLESEEE